MLKLRDILILCLFLAPALLSAQYLSAELDLSDTSQVHILRTKNGDQFVGKVLGIQDTEVRFLFNGNIELKFQLRQLESILVEGVDEQGRKSPNGRRKKRSPVQQGHESLFASPTAFGYGKGEGEYRNTMIFYNRVDFGIGDNFNLGGGVVPLISVNVFNLQAKANVSLSEYFHLGAVYNAFLVHLPFGFGADLEGVHNLSGILTLGSPRNFLNFTAGYGFPFADSSTGSSLFSTGGSYHLADKWRITGDILWIRDDSVLFFTAGASWMPDKNRLDFGMLLVSESGFPLAFPYVGYARRF